LSDLGDERNSLEARVQTLRLEPIQLPALNTIPPYLASLARAVERGSDLIPEITSVTREFGFDTLTYWASTRSTALAEGRTYEITTRLSGWSLRYDDMAYVEIDPRISAVLNQTLPVAWNQETWRGRTPAVDAFLDDAATFGIGSGVCVPIHDHYFGLVRVDFDSILGTVDAISETVIDDTLGPLSLIARFLHDVMALAIKRNEIRSRNFGIRLSQRELECLALAARSMTVDSELGLTRRIANLHFDSILAKLGCLNRDEAVAYALKKGLVAL
jgi:DNA-binding CsgD family transcriptional regulator